MRRLAFWLTSVILSNWADQNFNKFSGKKHSKIQFDPDENQWRIEVMNNPKIAASSYAAISTKAIGEKISLGSNIFLSPGVHEWNVTGDLKCSSKNQVSSKLVKIRNQTHGKLVCFDVLLVIGENNFAKCHRPSLIFLVQKMHRSSNFPWAPAQGLNSPARTDSVSTSSKGIL